MKRYTVVTTKAAAAKALHTNDVDDAFDFAFKGIEDVGVETVVSIPALKRHLKTQLIRDGFEVLDYPTPNHGTVGFTITDTLYTVAVLARKAAVKAHRVSGELEFDEEGAPVKRTDDGWKVECWVWVSAESAACEDLDEDADEDNVETGYIAAADHPSVEFNDPRASLGDDPGAYVSGWVTLTDAQVADFDVSTQKAQCAKWAASIAATNT